MSHWSRCAHASRALCCRRLKRFSSFAIASAIFLFGASAFADKVAVLPFTSPKSALPKPELDQARQWTNLAVTQRGDTSPTPGELLTAEMAVKDGSPDTSDEYRAAGRASGSQWTVTGRVERIDVPASKGPDGADVEGYTIYRTELEACQVSSGRVEALTRDLDPDEAPEQIKEMLALLIRAEGLGTSDIPWTVGAPRHPKAKPKPPPPPPEPSPPPPPPPPPAAPVVKHSYAENHPFALGVSIGLNDALSRPDKASGPSLALPLGVAFGYAIEALPGLEARAIFNSNVVGPKAIVLGAGARYAIPVLAQYRFFVGPEAVLGTHVAIGADKTARFLAQGSAFASLGLGEYVQVEIAGDLGAALGGTGTLVLGGGTLRGMFRF